MAHAYYHAQLDAKKFGGVPEDYLAIHAWFDQTKAHVADARHRTLLHNSLGIFICEQVFGVMITNSDGKAVAVRLIGESHVRADFGWIPSVEQCLAGMPLERWMFQGAAQLSRDPQLHVLKPSEEGRQVATPEEYRAYEHTHEGP